MVSDRAIEEVERVDRRERLPEILRALTGHARNGRAGRVRLLSILEAAVLDGAEWGNVVEVPVEVLAQALVPEIRRMKR